VHSFKVLDEVEAGVFLIDVVCSTGTYIRTLADDVGRVLGGGAHLRNLRRRAVGSFIVTEATPLESLTPDAARPMADLVVHMPRYTVDAEGMAAVSHGRALFDDSFLGLVADNVAVLNEAGELVAVYRPQDESMVADVVLLGN
jgi:tRNA pseudouridine55 synthase